MKKLFSLLSMVAFVATFSFAQDAAPAVEVKAEGPKMQFDSKEVDYGTIEQGSEPLRVFTFNNEGTEPLIIKNAKGSCGCTIPKWPKEPIMPGETSAIEVRYDTNRVGPFTKRVTLTTNENEENSIVLTIKGKVEKKPVEPSVPAVEDNGVFGNQ